MEQILSWNKLKFLSWREWTSGRGALVIGSSYIKRDRVKNLLTTVPQNRTKQADIPIKSPSLMSATPRLPGALLSPGGWGCHCTLLRLCLVSLPHFCSLLPLKMLPALTDTPAASLQFQIFYQFLATRRLHSRGTQSQADQFSQVSLHRQGISRPPEPPCWWLCSAAPC